MQGVQRAPSLPIFASTFTRASKETLVQGAGTASPRAQNEVVARGVLEQMLDAPGCVLLRLTMIPSTVHAIVKTLPGSLTDFQLTQIMSGTALAVLLLSGSAELCGGAQREKIHTALTALAAFGANFNLCYDTLSRVIGLFVEGSLPLTDPKVAVPFASIVGVSILCGVAMAVQAHKPAEELGPVHRAVQVAAAGMAAGGVLAALANIAMILIESTSSMGATPSYVTPTLSLSPTSESQSSTTPTIYWIHVGILITQLVATGMAAFMPSQRSLMTKGFATICAFMAAFNTVLLASLMLRDDVSVGLSSVYFATATVALVSSVGPLLSRYCRRAPLAYAPV